MWIEDVWIEGVNRRCEQKVLCLTFSTDGLLLASGGDDKKLTMRVAVTSDEVTVLPHADSVNAVAFSPDGSLYATGCNDNRVVVRALATDEEV